MDAHCRGEALPRPGHATGVSLRRAVLRPSNALLKKISSGALQNPKAAALRALRTIAELRFELASPTLRALGRSQNDPQFAICFQDARAVIEEFRDDNISRAHRRIAQNRIATTVAQSRRTIAAPNVNVQAITFCVALC